MKIGAGPVDLGEDILLYEGSGPLPDSLVGRHRFLDVLWLPCTLNELRSEQVFVINRFREDRIEADAQFKHANVSRRAALSLVKRMQIKSLLEIGCGKFPLAADLSGINYRAFEIDVEAISFCEIAGFDVRTPTKSLTGGIKFELAISLYALHFAIDEELVRCVDDNLTADGCLVFNLIADDGLSLLSKFSLLTRTFSSVRVIKEAALAHREFFVVMAKSQGDERAAKLAQELALSLQLTGSTPH